ncbi:hypothetical protein MHEL_02510 [Mycolicibacterium helvum]|uniref:Uncharacterized protein n=1 Tax=Mycolicibacterium helvum TaxID=1534349 RepID=A0A7I7SYX8_9MYCO|nr:hypothetical protein MHEL_02510 [Mycolicibacterium helvum]
MVTECIVAAEPGVNAASAFMIHRTSASPKVNEPPETLFTAAGGDCFQSTLSTLVSWNALVSVAAEAEIGESSGPSVGAADATTAHMANGAMTRDVDIKNP